MNVRELLGSIFSVLLVLSCSGALTESATAQTSTETTRVETEDGVDLDTQLYLLVGTNQDAGDQKLPAALDPVIKQLRGSLPFKNYRLAATLINRVKNNGRLNLRWVGGPLLTSATATEISPSFNEFKVNRVTLRPDDQGRMVVRMDGFSFGARIPIHIYSAVATAGTPPSPILNYENTGLNTDISLREGQPVVVGTLNLGPSGEAIILVVSAQRTSK